MNLSFPRPWRLLIPTLFLVGCALAAVILTESTSKTQAASPAAPSQAVAKQFGVFARPSSASDVLPADVGPTPATATVVRSIATGTPSLSEWATLAGNRTCVVINGTAPGAVGAPAACAELEPPHEEGELLSIVAGETGYKKPTILAGIAPDGVTSVTVTLADGTTHAVPVVENGFHLATGGSEPTVYEWTSGAGVKHKQTLMGGS